MQTNKGMLHRAERPITWLVFGGLGIGVGLAAGLAPDFAPLLALGGLLIGVGYGLAARPAGLLFGLAFLIAFQIQYEHPALAGATLTPQTLGALAIAGLILLATLSRQGVRRLVQAPYLGLILVYALLSAVSIARGPAVTSPVQGVWAVFRIVFAAPLLYLGLWFFLRTPGAVHRAAAWAAVGASLGGAAALMQTVSQGLLLSGMLTNARYLGIFPPLPPDVIADYSADLQTKLYLSGGMFRGHGTFLTHNGFGVLLASTIFLTWGLMRSAPPAKRLFWGVMLGAQVMGVIVTFSRSAWAAVLAGIFLLVAWNARAMLKRPSVFWGLVGTVALVLVSGVAAALAAPSFLERFLTLFSPTQVPEFAWRIAVWRFALSQVQAQPLLGTGSTMIDNAIAQIPASGPLARFSTHNLFMDVLYQRGVVVLLLYAGFWLIWLASILKLLREQTANPLGRDFILGLLAAGFAFLVSGVGSASMNLENLATLFWFLFGSVICLRWQILEQPATEPEAAARPAAAPLAALTE